MKDDYYSIQNCLGKYLERETLEGNELVWGSEIKRAK